MKKAEIDRLFRAGMRAFKSGKPMPPGLSDTERIKAIGWRFAHSQALALHLQLGNCYEHYMEKEEFKNLLK